MTSQSPYSHQLKVGIFIAIGLAVLLFSVLLVGGNKIFRNYAVLHAHFENVQGLSEGSLVSLAGVPVGNVEKFAFVPQENKLNVWLKIDESFLTRITENSLAEIRTQGALGDKFIYIIPGPQNGKPLRDGDQIQVSEGEDLLAVLSEKSGDVAKVFDIIEEVKKITSSFNADNRIDRIMQNLLESSRDFKAAAEDAKTVMAQMRSEDSKKASSAIDKLDRIMTKIDRGEGSLGAFINDPSLHESLKSMLGAPDKKSSIKSLIRSSIQKPSK